MFELSGGGKRKRKYNRSRRTRRSRTSRRPRSSRSRARSHHTKGKCKTRHRTRYGGSKHTSYNYTSHKIHK